MTASRSLLPGAALGLAALVAAPSASAADVGIEAHGGTLGAGLGLDITLNQRFGARVGFNRFSTGDDFQEGDLDYSADLELDSVHALLDWHPFGGTFRITGGVLANDNRVEGTANVQTGDRVGDSGVAVNNGRIGAEIGFDDAAPYLGIGWSSRSPVSGFSLSFDIGVLGQGSPEVELREEQNVIGVTRSDLEAEEKEVEDELSDFDTYPVVQVGVVYRF